MRNFKRCICKNKIKPNSAICYFAAASVKLMRLHGGNWHKIQLKGSPFLLCYSSFMPALISEELVCHKEENLTESVYGLSFYIRFINMYSETAVRGKCSYVYQLLIDTRAIVHLSADLGMQLLEVPGRERCRYCQLWYPAFAAKQTNENRSPQASQEYPEVRSAFGSSLSCYPAN